MRLVIDWFREAAKMRNRRSRGSGNANVTFFVAFTEISVARKYVEDDIQLVAGLRLLDPSLEQPWAAAWIGSVIVAGILVAILIRATHPDSN